MRRTYFSFSRSFTSLLFTLFLLLGLSACSGGSNDPATNAAPDADSPTIIKGRV